MAAESLGVNGSTIDPEFRTNADQGIYLALRRLWTLCQARPPHRGGQFAARAMVRPLAWRNDLTAEDPHLRATC